MRIFVSLIVMAMISTMAYAADPVASKSASASVSPKKSASSAAQPPKGLKGDPSATKGKLTAPPADEAPKAPASGSMPPIRFPK